MVVLNLCAQMGMFVCACMCHCVCVKLECHSSRCCPVVGLELSKEARLADQWTEGTLLSLFLQRWITATHYQAWIVFCGGSWVLNPNSHALEGKYFPTEPACDLGSLGNHSSSGTGTVEIPGNGSGLGRHKRLLHQTGLAQLGQERPWP